MKCPDCRTLLVTTERKGIDIDYCPSCYGIWLDRGELNLLIEREAEALAAAEPRRPPTATLTPLPLAGAPSPSS